MAISYKLKQLITDAYNIVRVENDMAISIAIIDNRHLKDTELILSSTGDTASLICLAAKAINEALKQSKMSKRKILKILDKVIDSAEMEGVADE